MARPARPIEGRLLRRAGTARAFSLIAGRLYSNWQKLRGVARKFTYVHITLWMLHFIVHAIFDDTFPIRQITHADARARTRSSASEIERVRSLARSSDRFPRIEYQCRCRISSLDYYVDEAAKLSICISNTCQWERSSRRTKSLSGVPSLPACMVDPNAKLSLHLGRRRRAAVTIAFFVRHCVIRPLISSRSFAYSSSFAHGRPTEADFKALLMIYIPGRHINYTLQE